VFALALPAIAGFQDDLNRRALADLEKKLAPESYPRMRDAGLEILERFPPDKYYYVGLGRSPTGVMTFLELYGVSDLKTVPITDLTPQGSSVLNQRLKEYFRKYFPTEAELRGRKILLIDYILSGDSFRKTLETLNGVVAPGKLEGFALGGNPFTQNFSVPVHRSNAAPGRTTTILALQKFDSWAKYKPMYATKIENSAEPPPLEENQSHKDFVSAYKKEMDRDRRILEHHFLRNCSHDFAQLP
jgi:hypothetical protein